MTKPLDQVDAMENKGIKRKIKNGLAKKYYLYPNSLRPKGDVTFFTAKDKENKYLGIIGTKEKVCGYKFSKNSFSYINDVKKSQYVIKLFNREEENLEILLKIFPDLKPSPLGINPTFGFGDRLGNANAAHIRIIKKNKNILPVLAQQSVRELEKTKKDFKQVIVSSLWNILQEGYSGKWGADADHIKDMENFKKSADAGMTMYTLDTSEHLEESVLNLEFDKIRRNYDLNTDYIKNTVKKYLNRKIRFGDVKIAFTFDTIIRLAILYGSSIRFAREIFLMLSEKLNSFDYEVSFDETNTITSFEAHYFLAKEMQDFGIRFTSIALRFPGTFEKGIDYIGDTAHFKKSINIHSLICRKIGGYKLSLHSGSDKFSIFPSFAKNTDGVFHIKTSGTSWLEAARIAAFKDPLFFRKLYNISYDLFETNKKAYHIKLDKKSLPPDLEKYSDHELPGVIDDRDLRRVFHIGYGAILDSKKDHLMRLLFNNEEKYYELLVKNFEKHFDGLNL